jgi:hypothetical protein
MDGSHNQQPLVFSTFDQNLTCSSSESTPLFLPR